MHDHGAAASGVDVDLVLAVPFALAVTLYGGGMVIQHRRGTPWPWFRGVLWGAGVCAAAAGFVGPLAAAAHTDFVAHMWAHTVVGMFAPLLLVLAAPMTLALRSVDVGVARRLSRLLASAPARFASAPIVAATASIGSLWLLYRTPLLGSMQEDPILHLLVSTHFLLAGYLFTAAVIPIDPAPHRAGFPLRTAVLLLALAGHGILAKTLYAHPPAGVAAAAAAEGAQVMYYAGDAVDAVIVTVLCAQWYRHEGRRLQRAERRRNADPAAAPGTTPSPTGC